jgi:hypothetical protein
VATEAKALPLELQSATEPRYSPAASAIADYWALTKPEVNLLVAVTVGVAFCLASTKDFHRVLVLALLNVLRGTLLIAGGSGALNQHIERRFDARRSILFCVAIVRNGRSVSGNCGQWADSPSRGSWVFNLSLHQKECVYNLQGTRELPPGNKETG